MAHLKYQLSLWGRGSTPLLVDSTTRAALDELAALWSARTGRRWKAAGVAASLLTLGNPGALLSLLTPEETRRSLASELLFALQEEDRAAGAQARTDLSA